MAAKGRHHIVVDLVGGQCDEQSEPGRRSLETGVPLEAAGMWRCVGSCLAGFVVASTGQPDQIFIAGVLYSTTVSLG
jgi:hypothetical protein